MIKYFSILRWFAHLNDSVKLSITLVLIVGMLMYANVKQYADNINTRRFFHKKLAEKDSILNYKDEYCREAIRLCNTKTDSLYERQFHDYKRQIAELKYIQERLKQGTWKPK